jgi:hypothetical protein
MTLQTTEQSKRTCQSEQHVWDVAYHAHADPCSENVYTVSPHMLASITHAGDAAFQRIKIWV